MHPCAADSSINPGISQRAVRRALPRDLHRALSVKKPTASLLFFILLVAAPPLRSQNTHGFPPPPRTPKNPPVSAKILAAKSVCLDNETRNSAVGREAVRELTAWGRFQVVNQNDAQLLMVLSTQEFAIGEFSPVCDSDGGTLQLSPKPLNAFLMVIDKATGDRVWIDSRPWGGVLTGKNSAGRRLIVRFRKYIEAKHSAYRRNV